MSVASRGCFPVRVEACADRQAVTLHAGVHDLLHPVHRFHHTCDCDGLHHNRADLLPAGCGGPPLVVALLPLRWLHRSGPALQATSWQSRYHFAMPSHADDPRSISVATYVSKSNGQKATTG